MLSFLRTPTTPTDQQIKDYIDQKLIEKGRAILYNDNKTRVEIFIKKKMLVYKEKCFVIKANSPTPTPGYEPHEKVYPFKLMDINREFIVVYTNLLEREYAIYVDEYDTFDEIFVHHNMNGTLKEAPPPAQQSPLEHKEQEPAPKRGCTIS